MKISCQSCQAKYTIADEKVLGKIVKIRCKKCSATIVINGNEASGGAAAAAAPLGATQDPGVYDYTQQGGSEQWTVNVADGDQRTMGLGEIIEAYKQMVVNDETYCWKDGMSDWLPLREIEQLYQACTLGPRPSLAPEGSVPQMNAHVPHQDEQPTRVQETNLGQLFGGSPAAHQSSRPPAQQHYSQPPAATNGNGAQFYAAAGGGMASSGAAARRAGGRGGQGADLFGGVAQAGGEDDVMTSVAGSGMPAPHPPGDGKLTGQRNENSVLFSLSALTNNAPQEDKSSAVGEGSGLIDIRALSASMETRSGPGSSRADDIMNLAGGGAFTPALAAPVLSPPSMDASPGYASMAPGADGGRGNKTLLLAAIGAFAFIVVGIIIAVAIVMSGKKDTEATTPAGTATMATATTTAAGTATTPTATAADTATAAPTGNAPADTTQNTQANNNKPPPNVVKPPPGNNPPPGPGVRPPPGNNPPPPPPPPPHPPAAGGCGCAPGDVDCAIRCSVHHH